MLNVIYARSFSSVHLSIFILLIWYLTLLYLAKSLVCSFFIDLVLICLCYLFCFRFPLFYFFGVRFSQERALLLFLRYASRWGNQTMRGFIKVGVTEPARHCAPYICPCQFIEEHLKCKPQGKLKYLKCGYWCSASEYYD